MELQELDEAIVAKEAELIHVGVTPQRRLDLLADLRALQNDAAEVQDELHDMSDTLRHRRADLDHALEHAPRY